METIPLDASGNGHWSEETIRWLAGLDSAVFASVLAVSWYVFSAWLRGEYWWAPLNVAGALFYGDRAFQLGIGRATLAGAALLVLLYSLLGTLLARAVPAPLSFTRVLIVSLTGALLWQLAAARFVWALLHPFAPGYFPAPAAWAAHLLFAIALTRLPRRRLALAAALGPPLPLQPPLSPPPLDPASPPPPPCPPLPVALAGDGSTRLSRPSAAFADAIPSPLSAASGAPHGACFVPPIDPQPAFEEASSRALSAAPEPPSGGVPDLPSDPSPASLEEPPGAPVAGSEPLSSGIPLPASHPSPEPLAAGGAALNPPQQSRDL